MKMSRTIWMRASVAGFPAQTIEGEDRVDNHLRKLIGWIAEATIQSRISITFALSQEQLDDRRTSVGKSESIMQDIFASLDAVVDDDSSEDGEL